MHTGRKDLVTDGIIKFIIFPNKNIDYYYFDLKNIVFFFFEVVALFCLALQNLTLLTNYSNARHKSALLLHKEKFYI
jgi:hypothetical protein